MCRTTPGTALHPKWDTIQPFLDNLSSQISERAATLLVTPLYCVPSTGYMRQNHPSSLVEHLRSLIPSSQPEDGGHNKQHQNVKVAEPESKLSSVFEKATSASRWNWPEVLTFGRSPRAKIPSTPKETPIPPSGGQTLAVDSKDIDQECLADAMESSTLNTTGADELGAAPGNPSSHSSGQTDDINQTPEYLEVPELSFTTVFVTATERSKVHYLTVIHTYLCILIEMLIQLSGIIYHASNTDSRAY
jgi:hypothetical protein